MKKISFSLLMIFVIALSGCTSNNTPSNPQESDQNNNETTPADDSENTENSSENSDANENNAENTEKPSENTSDTTLTTQKSYTLEEVAKHSTSDDCWMVIHGKVYDVTQNIPKHPGGEAILLGCGKDSTELFEKKPGSEEPHSDKARGFLEKSYIGDLQK